MNNGMSTITPNKRIELYGQRYDIAKFIKLRRDIQGSFIKKWETNINNYYIAKTNSIILRRRSKLHLTYKELLLNIDPNEFLGRYYTERETAKRLPLLLDFYSKICQVYPNYIVLEEEKYIQKNLNRKQRLLNEQADLINRMSLIKNKNTSSMLDQDIMQDQDNIIFTDELLESLNSDSVNNDEYYQHNILDEFFVKNKKKDGDSIYSMEMLVQCIENAEEDVLPPDSIRKADGSFKFLKRKATIRKTYELAKGNSYVVEEDPNETSKDKNDAETNEANNLTAKKSKFILTEELLKRMEEKTLNQNKQNVLKQKFMMERLKIFHKKESVKLESRVSQTNLMRIQHKKSQDSISIIKSKLPLIMMRESMLAFKIIKPQQEEMKRSQSIFSQIKKDHTKKIPFDRDIKLKNKKSVDLTSKRNQNNSHFHNRRTSAGLIGSGVDVSYIRKFPSVVLK